MKCAMNLQQNEFRLPSLQLEGYCGYCQKFYTKCGFSSTWPIFWPIREEVHVVLYNNVQIKNGGIKPRFMRTMTFKKLLAPKMALRLSSFFFIGPAFVDSTLQGWALQADLELLSSVENFHRFPQNRSQSYANCKRLGYGKWGITAGTMTAGAEYNDTVLEWPGALCTWVCMNEWTDG